jgi:hypothetical protein
VDRYASLTPLPERVSRLAELATDLWWSWRPEARGVFRRLDYSLWRATAHNPVRMLWLIPRDKIEAAAADPDLPAAVRCRDRGTRRRARRAQHLVGKPVSPCSPASRSPTFRPSSHCTSPCRSTPVALAYSLAITARKRATSACRSSVSASCTHRGTFTSSCLAEGWQEEVYERLNWADAAIEPAVSADGKPFVTAVPLGDRSVLVAVWRVRVGRVKLYLLDTDLEENAPWDRELSARLYGGDRETRIQQEIILGIGGVRALKAIGSAPSVFHLNEGHAGFVVLQRIRDLIEKGSSFDTALEEISATTVFTTHTPVPAGHDAFPFSLVEKHLAAAGAPSARIAIDSWRSARTTMARRAVQHDRARPPIVGRGQRREQIARRGHPRHVGSALAGPAAGSASGRIDHQRRPRADVDCVRYRGTSLPGISDATGSTATTTPQSSTAFCGFRMRNCGPFAGPSALSLYICPRARSPALDRRTRRHATRRRGRDAARARRVDDRIRRAFTGYKRPELIFHDPSGSPAS